MTLGNTRNIMTAGPTVSVGYTKALVDFAVSKGAKETTLLNRAQLSHDDLIDVDDRLPFSTFVTLMRESKDLCQDPAFPLHFGAAENFDQISVVGLLCYSAPTMGDAFLALNRFGYLVLEVEVPKHGERFQLTPCEDGVLLIDTRLNPNSFPELTEATWARFICEQTRNFPGRNFAKKVFVTHPKPAHSTDYEQLFQVPIVFNSDKNAVLIEESWPSVELHKPNSYIFGVLSERAEKLLLELSDAGTVRSKVESIMIPNLQNGDLGMNTVAKDLGYSRQTLYRKLKEEGTSYERTLDELRHKMALHYLNGRKATVNETAYLVGFSDPSAFSRAFKRWTGARPGSAIKN